MASLYEIDKRIQEFEIIFDEETGEVLNAEEYDAINLEFNQKKEATALKIKANEVFIKNIDEEIKRLQEKKKRINKSNEWLKNYLNAFIDGQAFETPRVKVGFRKSSNVVIESEQDFINWAKDEYPELINEKISISPNKKDISKLIKSGINVAHCHIEEKNNMNIK